MVELSRSIRAAAPATDWRSLVDMLRSRAAEQADQRLYTYLADGEPAAALTFGTLDARARAIGAWLQAQGATGERALLAFPQGLDFIAAFMGCLYAGVVAVPVYPPRPNRVDPRIQAIVADAQPAVALTTRELLASFERQHSAAPDPVAVRWTVLDDVAALDDGSHHEGVNRGRPLCDLAAEWRDPGIGGSDLAFLQYTSGSTAAPKGVMISHANLLHNLAYLYQVGGSHAGSVGVSWLPAFHDMGLIDGLLHPLYGGFPCYLMAPA